MSSWLNWSKFYPSRYQRVHPARVMAPLEHLHTLVQQDVARARVEIQKHLDGPMTITPRPSLTGERRVEIRGRVKPHSLLGEQEAVVYAGSWLRGWI
jgi:hypothetical protein